MLNYIKTYLTELLELTNEMAPYLLLGFFFAGILHVFIKEERIVRFMGGRNFRSALNSSLIGIPLPLCSCGVIPTGVSLYKNGASKGSSVSFLVSTPQTGVDSVLVTWSMLGLPFALARLVIALITGVFGGGLTNLFTKKDPKAPIREVRSQRKGNKLQQFVNYAFVEFLQDISKWLLIGLGIAALIAVVVPDDFFTQYINIPILSMLIVLAASVPLYVCATGSVPVAAVLLMKGLSPGAALVFLMAGPATNAATMTVIGNSMGRKTLFAYLASIIGGALAFGLIIDYAFPADFFTAAIPGMQNGHTHEVLPYWLKLTSTIILGLLIINGLIQRFFKHSKKENTSDMPVKTIMVSGMTCNHCKKTVETNLSNLEGIKSVNADITKSTVEIDGENFDLETIKNTVNDLGYEYKGEK